MTEQPTTARAEGVAGVLGVGVVLLLLGMTAFSSMGQRTRLLSPDEFHQLYGSWFEAGELPFDLRPVEGARQPGGETLLRLADPDAAPEAPKSEPPPKPSGTPEKSAGMQLFDWSAIPIGPANTPPREALFATWPLASARKQIPALFSSGSSRRQSSLRERSRGVDPLAGMDAKGGRRVLNSGRLLWGDFEVPFVLERTFEPGGTFVDSLRVNLSTESEGLVLFLRWGRGLPASTERAEEFLGHLRRASAPAEPAATAD